MTLNREQHLFAFTKETDCSFTPDTILLQMGPRHLCLYPLLLCNCIFEALVHLVWRATRAVSAARHRMRGEPLSPCGPVQGVLQSELRGDDRLSQNEPDVVNRLHVSWTSGGREKQGRHLLLTVHLKFCVSGLLVCSSFSLYENISTLELSKKEGKYLMVISSSYKIEVWQLLPELPSLLKYYSSPGCAVVG